MEAESGQGRTEGIAQIKADIAVLTAQAETMASDLIQTEVLERRIDGAVGESSSAVADKIQTVARAIAEVSGNVPPSPSPSRPTSGPQRHHRGGRAGEAGKGFAVVADEVKDLARQTATSTADIEAQIAEIREQVTGTVRSIAAIVESINTVNSALSSIAGAIEEQSAAVGEVGKNIIATSGSANEIQLVQLG